MCEFQNGVIMYTVIVTYSGRNKIAKALINSLATIKGVEIKYNFSKNAYKNGLDMRLLMI